MGARKLHGRLSLRGLTDCQAPRRTVAPHRGLIGRAPDGRSGDALARRTRRPPSSPAAVPRPQPQLNLAPARSHLHCGPVAGAVSPAPTGTSGRTVFLSTRAGRSRLRPAGGDARPTGTVTPAHPYREADARRSQLVGVAVMERQARAAVADVADRRASRHSVAEGHSRLDSRGLVALWREGPLAQAVLKDKTKEYRRYPRQVRFHRPTEKKPPIQCHNGGSRMGGSGVMRDPSFKNNGKQNKLQPLCSDISSSKFARFPLQLQDVDTQGAPDTKKASATESGNRTSAST